MKWRSGLSLLAIVLIVFSSLSPVFAQSVSTPGFAASISPLPILLNAKPGTSVSADLRVNNPSAHAERLKVIIKTFTQDGPDGTVTLHDPSPGDDFIKWISFSKTEFDAPPGLWQTVKMTIKVPPSASFGYYFAVEFTSADAPAKANTGAAVQGAVASFVLLNAESPGEKRDMRVTSFTADHKFYEFLPANFTIRLHNSGNVYAGASGNIFIMRGNRQVGVLNVNENHGLVLPDSNRLFSVNWDSGFPVYKTINGKKRLNWNFGQVSKLRFGHYTAKLALVYNDGQRDVPISGSLSFWVIPRRIIIGFLVVVIFMVIGFWSTFRKAGRFVRRQAKRSDRTKPDES
jgi:hypothetical protein